jgi:ribonuclease HI
VGSHFATIAVVAHDWTGSVVLAISKKIYTTNPLQAEAEAILWAAQLAIDMELDIVCIERDSKTCIDALNCNLASVPWHIQTCI